MARYVLLRIADDREADDLLRGIAAHPDVPVLAFSGLGVHAEVVPDIDPSDFWSKTGYSLWATDRERARKLRAVLCQSYERAFQLADEWEASA